MAVPVGVRPASKRYVALVAVLSLPILGLILLIVEPRLDVAWAHHPSHFWLVLAAGAAGAALAYATGIAARQRGDARVFLASLAFLSAAGFLGLHALATPGVLLEGPNAGFTLATPVGLLVAAGFAAASGLIRTVGRAQAIMRQARLVRWLLLAAMTGWAIASLTGVPPLDSPAPPERASGPLIVLAIVGVVLYAVAVIGYLRIPRRSGAATLPLAMACAWALLAEAEVAVAVGRNWHVTWWEWHALMLAAFGLVAWSAHRQWHEERFAGLYLEGTAAGTREISVLYADLQGFTTFSEQHSPVEVTAMLNEYFESAIPAVVDRFGGHLDRIVGDALMATWGTRGDQPEHARQAALAAVEMQRVTGDIAGQHPGWPRFRVGVNTGTAAVGVLGTAGGRTFTAIGDTVNLAARLEAAAPVGGVLVGAETARQLPDATLEPLGPIQVKGKTETVEAYQLLAAE